MLDIVKRSENGIGVIELSGELDTTSSVNFQKEIEGFLDNLTDLTIDMKNLEYITSAGLRVLLLIDQTMEDQGSFKVINVNEDVMDVFEVSGFSEVLDIQ
ncbi:MAG TPA: anti-sigma factor antagonist [Lachnospiraceae bacterium]|nr:anti-sigma factor antagonist [Lachnospiraceae bacterium]